MSVEMFVALRYSRGADISFCHSAIRGRGRESVHTSYNNSFLFWISIVNFTILKFAPRLLSVDFDCVTDRLCAHVQCLTATILPWDNTYYKNFFFDIDKNRNRMYVCSPYRQKRSTPNARTLIIQTYLPK